MVVAMAIADEAGAVAATPKEPTAVFADPAAPTLAMGIVKAVPTTTPLRAGAVAAVSMEPTAVFADPAAPTLAMRIVKAVSTPPLGVGKVPVPTAIPLGFEAVAAIPMEPTAVLATGSSVHTPTEPMAVPTAEPVTAEGGAPMPTEPTVVAEGATPNPVERMVVTGMPTGALARPASSFLIYMPQNVNGASTPMVPHAYRNYSTVCNREEGKGACRHDTLLKGSHRVGVWVCGWMGLQGGRKRGRQTMSICSDYFLAFKEFCLAHSIFIANTSGKT
jgi:hypothetical protein